jgi:hypothetical protein
MEIKPIETQYKGYRFRSRLEARWAVFFDALGIEWEYEKEGFNLGNAGWYLPDFWLPTYGVFVEIKPSDMSAYEHSRVLALRGQAPVILLCGEPGKYQSYDYGDLYTTTCADLGEWGMNGSLPAFGFRSDGEFSGYMPKGSPDQSKFDIGDPVILEAIAASRSARFEHGESPRLRS